MYLEAIKGDVNAGKALMEQHGGKSPKALKEFQLDLAEHRRKVERDRVDLVLRMLGDRINTMDPATELVPLIMECASNTRGFLDVVERSQQVAQECAGEAIDVAPVETPGEETKP
jgi:hypothetical protein